MQLNVNEANQRFVEEKKLNTNSINFANELEKLLLVPFSRWLTNRDREEKKLKSFQSEFFSDELNLLMKVIFCRKKRV